MQVIEESFTTLGLTCTDPDNLQFGQQLTYKKFQFIEVERESKFYEKFRGYPEKMKLELFDFVNIHSNDWVEMIINIDDYSYEQILDIVGSYYSKHEIDEWIINQDYWIIAECIFEQENGLY